MENLVSVIIPVFNRETLIGETLNSILAQSHANWECILVDDGSTDGSSRIILEYVDRDDRFRYFKRPENRSKGANSCRNFGFEKSVGKYVNWFDSDDLMHEDFLRIKVMFFEQHPGLDAVLTKRTIFVGDPANITGKEHRTFLGANAIEDFITLKSAWYIQDPMWNRAFLNGKILFDEALLAGQDRDFHARMLLHDPKMHVLDEYLALNRSHAQSITASIDSRKDTRLKISHLKSVEHLVRLLSEKNRLSPKIRVVLFLSLIKYLPYVISTKENFLTLLGILKQLSFASPLIYKGWIKFWTAWLSFRIFGKGAKLLK